MPNGTKTYRVVINGVQESINAVDSLNKSLKDLEDRITALENKNLKITGTGTNGKSNTNPSKQLTEQERLEKKILETEKKLEEVRDENYKKLLHMKEELREYNQIAKSTVAAEANQQGLFDTNTMAGMKAQLKSIKAEMQTLDVNGDRFKNLIAQANELNNKLLQIEKGYGQYGRNVGNYANGVAEGMNKIKVAVGDSTREFDNYRQAVKTLREERFNLSQTLGQESEEYKKIDIALKRLESDYKDLNQSSQFMDNMFDTMHSFMSLASIGQGLSTLFDIDDEDFQKTMQKFAGLSMILQGIDGIMRDIQRKEGFFGKFIENINESAKKWELAAAKRAADKFNKENPSFVRRDDTERWGIDAGDILKIKNKEGEFEKIRESLMEAWTREYQSLGKTSAEAFDLAEQKMDALLKGVKNVTRGVKVLKLAVGALTAAFMLFLPDIIEGISNFVKNLNSAKVAEENAEMAMNTLNRALKTQMDLLSSRYLSKEISDQEYLTKVYEAQSDALAKQIGFLQERAKSLQETFGFFSNWDKFLTSTKNLEFNGQKLDGEKTVGHGRLTSTFRIDRYTSNDFEYTVHNIQEVEKAWKECNEAIKEGKDYFDKWGTGFGGLLDSLFVTMKDTQEVMRGLGNIKLSDTIADFQRVNEQFNKGEISAEKYQKELARLRNEMNNNEILQSVIANLDKYIPDEKVRTAVQNIINEIYRLDDAFNMTSPEQIHYWNQVRIDAMKDGYAKAKAQIDENERYEIQQRGHTEEQIQLLQAKYNRQRQEAQERYNKKNTKDTKSVGKKLRDIENELQALRIENMKEGEKKAIAQLEHQRDLELQKAREYGKKYAEFEAEINAKYRKKIEDEERRWRFNRLKVYEDFLARIDQLNRATFEKETATATQKVRSREKSDIYNTGYDFISPVTYDDTKTLEAYYQKVLEIQTKTAEKEQAIRQENLDKMLDYDKKEEEMRHRRLIDENGGDYIQQLRAGLISQEEYNNLIEQENNAHYARMNAIEREYQANSSASTEEYLDSIYNSYDSFFGNLINDVRKDFDKINDVMEKQPIKDKAGWGIVNISATSAAYKKALAMAEELKNGIIKKQEELAKALKDHKISAEDFAIRQGELDNQMKAIDSSVESIKGNQKQLVGDFIQSIQQYVQAGLQAVSDLMNSIWQYQDSIYEHEMNELEKQIDKYEELLDKQREITEQHKDAIDEIEDELATSRGDRRQHLIDQLNAEIEAQRRSLIEQKRIEREEEKLKKKKEKEEEAQRKREHQRQVAQAFISWHLSVANALATEPFVPVGIAMGALATALGAAQFALVKSQKYAEGGQLSGGLVRGKRHSQGGVPVGNTGIEVEGNEMIIRRESTMPNLDLLNYINKSKRKINLDDLIEFYSGKGKKSIKSISPTKMFAQGGNLPPLLSNNINVDSRLINALENYADRDVVVSVVDINRRQQAVKNVQVLAGLNE